MKHTPGPWTAVELKADGAIILQDGRYEIRTPEYDVATYLAYSGPIRKKEDAVLIAAAPDLLEACKLAKQHLEAMRVESGMGNVMLPFEKQTFEQVDKVLSEAIEKAEGKE